MGILNVTPDSFSDGGAWLDPQQAFARGQQLAAQGADVLDVGAESTRPGAPPVSASEEWARLEPVIGRLARSVRIPLSVDTSKAVVAAAALKAGASIVNDVTALRGDPDMAGVIAKAGAAVVLMHMQGTPKTMQRRPRYRDVAGDVSRFLLDAAQRAQAAGISKSRILIDPGLGFGKSPAHNLTLLSRLDRLTALGLPVVVGPSRKSFIGRTVGGGVHDRLGGTLASVAIARARGAYMVRVHDVQATVQFLTMLDLLEGTDAARR
jgi:dihydropteroate synthase